MKPSVRSALLACHTGIGLTVGLALVIAAVSGAFLLFRDKIERRVDASRFVVSPGPARLGLDELVDRARAAHPAGDVENVRFYGDPTKPLLVQFTTSEYVHLNPHTGAVLGIRSRFGSGYGWIDGLHRFLRFEPKVGRNITGTLAGIYALFILLGLALWWPASRRALKAGLTLDPKLTGRRWHLNLHRTLGAYAALVVLFSALTGVTIAREGLRGVFYFITGSTPDIPPDPPAQPPVRFIGFETLAREVDRLMPNARETYLMPSKPGLVTSGVVTADSPHPNARSYVWFDGGTGAIIRHTPYARMSAGYRLYSWLLSLHTGATGGIAVKLLLLFGTLSVPVLACTGIGSYLRRKRQVQPSR